MTAADVDFYLASTSPRRRELLHGLCYRFAVLPVAVEEVPQPGERAPDYVRRVALDKARAGRALLAATDGRPVIGADTEVVVDGAILGKPVSLAQARRMLGRLAGRAHRVLSAVALVSGEGARVELSETTVRMRAISGAEIDAYWASGEPRDKAGGYAIQGLAAEFITGIEGSYTGVVGLPLAETAALLRACGIEGWQHARGKGG